MKYLGYLIKRWWFTVQSKFAAVIASKIKVTWTFDFLAWSLKKRDETLIRESKFCMLKTVTWQNRAKKCIIAHHEYEKELKKEEKVKEAVNK